MKVKYEKGKALYPDRSQRMQLQSAMPRSMSIRMPIVGTEEYFETHVKQWLHLSNDDDLVQGLHDYMVELRVE